MEAVDEDVATLVDALGAQDVALGDLFPAAYERLRSLAHAQRRRWNQQETLSTTALVHEVYLKLSRHDEARWHDKRHFLRVAARAMRHILIDYAERRQAANRGDGIQLARLGNGPDSRASDERDAASPWNDASAESRIVELLALDEALTRLARQNPRQAQVVELRFFAGLDVEETADALGVAAITVMRDWRRGKSWLYLQLKAR
jgi:RNA polymerase sigma factor (TIGR02999 family)